jgi:hypothetical protein
VVIVLVLEGFELQVTVIVVEFEELLVEVDLLVLSLEGKCSIFFLFFACVCVGAPYSTTVSGGFCYFSGFFYF